MDNIIEIKGLKKSYGNVKAVNGIDFYVEPGTLFAFLGPNGAGKSTTIDMISTLLEPDEGEILIDGYTLGKDDSKIRSVLGIVFQDSLLDNLLTVKENLMTRGNLYEINTKELKKSVEYATECTGVKDFLDRPYGKLSGGQRRRADIARALINTPKILILDEPTTGLDPQTRQNVWETIERLKKEKGMTIFLTTHYMEEAARADYVVVIDSGEITAKGTPSELKEAYSSDYMAIHTSDMEDVTKILMELGYKYEINVDAVTIKLESTLQALPILEKCKGKMIGFQVMKGTMDDAFINITGKELRE
ncbi:multidrug/hemolysin transport system ATP-binding protein [Mobilisporobacter senegalensis]|uniref:Multidrug/hemolysin transport system ATP-binding protein n=1 Tax=Mobilisporobacter senegalensis TaxID=1329262 RepID=A0A3N1XZX9_9FIRM|nr:ABC transporter ATP-binding protein [Mobilisporobacter senegalensis]ROR31838.1 multidrug/hemolysin transport system ATP-binding protein [Mobilisporobacter senegalensis]